MTDAVLLMIALEGGSFGSTTLGKRADSSLSLN